MKKFFLSGTIFIITFVSTFLLLDSRNLTAPPDDGKFYFKIAILQADQGFIHNYPWLYHTEYRDSSPGLHFLYPILLTPFTVAFSPMLAYVISSAFFLAVLATLIWKLLLKFEIKFKGLWILVAFLGSQDFIFRHSLGRPITASLIVMLGIIYAFKSRIPWIVCILAMINVWMYDGYFISVLLMLGFAVGIYIAERKWYVKELIAGGIGFLIGNIINPFFPENIKFLHTFVTVPFLNQRIQDSNEWMPYGLEYLISSNLIIIVLWVVSVLYVVWKLYKDKKVNYDSTGYIGYGLIATALLILTILHRRFIEYLPIFAVLFFVTTFKSHLDRISFSAILKTFKKFWQFQLALLIIVAITSLIFYKNLSSAASDLKSNDSKGDTYKKVSLFLESQPTDEAIVFNVQWDQFVHLFYWDSKHYYINGLDPGFLHDYSPELYNNWKKFYDDEVNQLKSEEILLILKQFGARYIFIELDRSPNMYAAMSLLAESSLVKQIYEEDNMIIYEIK